MALPCNVQEKHSVRGTLLASPPGRRGARTTGGGPRSCVGKYPCMLRRHDARERSHQRAGASVRALSPLELDLASPTMGRSVHRACGELQSTAHTWRLRGQSHIQTCSAVRRCTCTPSSVSRGWNPCCVPMTPVGPLRVPSTSAFPRVHIRKERAIFRGASM